MLSYPSAEKQSMYSTAPADWATQKSLTTYTDWFGKLRHLIKIIKNKNSIKNWIFNNL